MSNRMRAAAFVCTLVAFTAFAAPVRAQSIVPDLEQEIRQRAAAIEDKLIAWRRDIHEHPELASRRHAPPACRRTFEAARPRGEDRVAKTGVVALLKGGKPGPVVALRADMDALPVKEPALAVRLQGEGKILGREVDVMHACGHDAHTAILMATAEVLTAMKDKLPGT